MKSPPGVRVRVDAQGRMVLPRHLRDELVAVPGEVMVRRTQDGLLITPAEPATTVEIGGDGLPLLSTGRRVANIEILDAIDRERAQR